MTNNIASLADRRLQKQKSTVDALWDDANEKRQKLIVQIHSGHWDMETLCACADAWRAWKAAFDKEGA